PMEYTPRRPRSTDQALRGDFFRSLSKLAPDGRKNHQKACSRTLFADFDDRIEPFLKQHYDHGMLINVHDPLYESLCLHTRRTGEQLKLKLFDAPTTVENLAHRLFSEITEMGFRLQRLEVRETDSSVVVYTRDDWVQDNRYFSQRPARALLDPGSACLPTSVNR
ncbi:MAG: 6-carboxytetrahydropterin synthase, partial [Pirellulaceae bacterium]|nr:6-carboxytetrahydropterin synthase [Pirellulaceae bacterium]